MQMQFECQYAQIEEKHKQVENEKLHLFLTLEKKMRQLEQEKLHLEARVSAMSRGPLLSKNLQLEEEKLHLEASELALTDQLTGLGVLFREQDKRIVAQSQHIVEQNDQIRELKVLVVRFMEAPVLETEEVTPEQLVVDDKSIVGVERRLEINEASAPAQKKQKVAAAADGPVAVKAEVF